jgi:hypothetical protein
LQQVSCLTFCSDAGADGIGSQSYLILVEQQGLCVAGPTTPAPIGTNRCSHCSVHEASLSLQVKVQADAVNIVCMVFWSPQQPKTLKFVAPTGSEGPMQFELLGFRVKPDVH